jgi:hypothetical protein
MTTTLTDEEFQRIASMAQAKLFNENQHIKQELKKLHAQVCDFKLRIEKLLEQSK